MKRLWICSIGILLAVALQPLPAFSQAGPQQCVAFNSLADQHTDRAAKLLKAIEIETQNLPVDEIARIMQERSAAAGSESQLADLAREAYKKCLSDYIAGGAPAPPQQAVRPPVQQAAPQQPVQQAPARQSPVKQKKPVQQTSPVQEQQQRVYRQQPQQQQHQQGPGIFIGPGGLIDLGIGIGIGR